MNDSCGRSNAAGIGQRNHTFCIMDTRIHEYETIIERLGGQGKSGKELIDKHPKESLRF